MKELEIKELIKKRLTNDYIAGFVHGNGEFSIELRVEENSKRKLLKLLPKFTLTQHVRNIELIKEIKKRLGDKGSYKIDNKKIIRYRVSSIKEFNENLIPYFDKYQVKSEKLKNYIKLKYIVEKLLSIDKSLR
ncbi:LAGLIDADG family homing endonuclease [Enterobacter mori]